MRILIGTDGSDSAASAVDLVGSLPNLAEHTVRLVTAMPERVALLGGPWPDVASVMPDVEEAAAQELHSRLDQDCRRLGATGTLVETALLRVDQQRSSPRTRGAGTPRSWLWARGATAPSPR